MTEVRNQSEHNVFVLSPPETLNTCNKILIFNSADVSSSLGSVSLYNISEIYSYVITNLVPGTIDVAPKAKLIEKKDNGFLYEGDLRGGFNIIICISDSGEPLGYIKYLEIQGTRSIKMNIIINLETEVQDYSTKLNISYDIDGIVIEKDEMDKYKDYLKISQAREITQDGYNQYSNHVSAGVNMFLGDLSVVEGEAIKLDLCYGEKINPYPDTTFDYYSIGYVAGGDLALYSWSSDKYSVTSLSLKDIYGNPKSYIKTKEGRAPVPKYIYGGKEKDVTVEYISGRYIACNVGNLGIKLYDSYLGSWLEGNTLISDPYSEINKIYSLASNRVPYNDLARLVPAVRRAFILPDEKRKILHPYRIIGNWVVFKETGSSDRLLVCGPTVRLYILASEFNKLFILNDNTLILKSGDNTYQIYSGQFSTFASPNYSKAYPDATYGNEELKKPDSAYSFEVLDSPLKFYKRVPGNIQADTLDIIATFAGLIFYKNSENRFYYL